MTEVKYIMNKLIVIVTAALALSACSSVPEKLRATDNQPLISFEEVKGQVNANIGLSARWGGVIAKVENLPEKTMIEVVNLELTASTRPKPSQETLGRFRIYYSGLLDPVIYKQGKTITAIGIITESEQGKIGEHDYQFPVLNADNVYLWKDIKRVDVNVNHSPFWYTPFFHPYYNPYHHRTTVVIKDPSANKPRINVPKDNQSRNKK